MDHNNTENNKDTKSAQPNQEAPQTNQQPTEEKKSSSWQIILTVIAIIAIILIFALPDQKNTDDTATTTENGMETVEDVDSQTEEVIAPGVKAGPNTKSGSMTPISVDNEFVYSFSGIDWFLEPVDGGTAVQFKFSEFSRREGSIVAFGNPYRLGVFPGECIEVESLAVGNITDTPLSYVSCRTETSSGNDIALFQDGAKVYAAQRTFKDGVGEDFTEFFARDITTIVR